MGSSVDSYLHKKFKKQLSIEPKPQNHDKENKVNSRVVEPSEEKRTFENGHGTVECSKVVDNQVKKDNNESVPNKSTNQNSSYFSVNSSFNSKSSISNDKCITNLQSNPCISSDISSSKVTLDSFRRVNFDTQFNNPVPSTVRSSSNDNSNSKPKYVSKPDDISSSNSVESYQSKEDVAINNKQEEVQPPPDRNSSGKYVCNYCNLVCSKPSVLQKHIRAHTNERPYPCVSCGFSFKTRSNLYKHCRSRTHANRVMGNKAQEITNESESTKQQNISKNSEQESAVQSKPYKPRFHTTKLFDSVAKENIDDERQDNVQYNHNPDAKDFITHHINDIINKNSSIVNSNDVNLLKKRLVVDSNVSNNNNDYYPGDAASQIPEPRNSDEPLNLSNKNRKRSMSEVVAEPQVQKSLIKELLLKNVYSNINMQCTYCKMIFQTVTELELHEFRSCKGKPSGAKYTRSSSVNVASILTQNKNAFDNIPYLQNTTFPLNSPGPFLGKTRLVESDKSKSFSFDDGLRSMSNDMMSNFSLLPFEKKMPVKLFGGEVKIAQSTGETKKFKIDSKTQEKFETSKSFDDFSDKMSENRVIKFSLQSGGTVLTNKSKTDARPQDIMRNYEMMSSSPSIDLTGLNKPHFNFDRQPEVVVETVLNHRDEVMRPVVDEANILSPSVKSPNIYPNIMDFSQKAVKMLTPNIKQPSIIVSASPTKFMFEDTKPVIYDMECDEPRKPIIEKTSSVIRKVVPVPRPSPTLPSSPVNLLVNGKLVRHVPGMPGPVVAEEPIDMAYSGSKILVTSPRPKFSPLALPTVRLSPEPMDTSEPPNEHHPRIPYDRFTKPYKTETLEIKTDFLPKTGERRSPNTKISEFRSPIKSTELKSPLGIIITESKKFARPNSLALKPTTASLKQHHGLTPTMFNQILISPDTPRVNKKYVHHFLHGNYFSYLDLKSSTKPVYCTLNKTQPFYVPHFKKLSMYSEWRQQDTKTDKLFVSAYDSRQKPQRYSQGGRNQELQYVDSNYKFMVSELPSTNVEKFSDLSSSNAEKEEPQKPNQILGGYESNEDYTYIRGRGRGRYVCEQCGIRCKKPSMLKKHIRTHSIDRPYTCNHCNFSFKTKGNLTKHMKSKVHTKNYSAGSSSSSSTQQSGTQSSDSDTDDSGMDSSDESTRQQEHEAAYGLLSLSQKTTQNLTPQPDAIVNSSSLSNHCYSPASSVTPSENVMSSIEINYLSKFNIAKNKTLEERTPLIVTAPTANHESTTSTTDDSFSDPPPHNNSHEKNSLAKSVASEYLKIATQFEINQDGVIDATNIGPINKDVNDLIVKPEGNKTCGICHKSFSKPSQLRLHMNIHYLERPFRCDSCSVSFRSKGHLLKHERSASHHNKLSASSVQASAEPRPFKCSDCNIAFRIHGHLAKHLRSKMHIMKLECLAKIPFGLYAELERSNSLLTEINTCDGDQCLESLKTLAKKVFINDPGKLNQMDVTDAMDADS